MTRAQRGVWSIRGRCRAWLAGPASYDRQECALVKLVAHVRREAMEVLRHVIAAQGPEDSEVQKRVQEIETLFGLRQDASGTLVPFAPARGTKRP